MEKRFFIVSCINTIKVDRHFETNAVSVEDALAMATNGQANWWDVNTVKSEPYLVQEEVPKTDGDGWHFVTVWERKVA